MSNGQQKYFVRIHGKIMGPFEVDQMRSLRDRGRLRAEHEISLDRRRWEPASQLQEVFERAEPAAAARTQAPAAAPAASAATEAPASNGDGTQWFYTR